MRRKIAVVVSFTLLCCAGALLADEVLLGQIYGTGVHAFNAGDYVGAYDALTSAIKGGSNDPRAYYFRGLAYLKLGRDDEAKADFSKGAELEVADSVNEYPVNRSLERIQGKPRQMLEYYRMTVHAVAVQRQEAARQARYEQRAAAEQDVLRRVAPAQLPAVQAAPVPSTQIPPQVEKAVNPFEQATEPAPAPAKPAMDVEKNPFEPAPPAQRPAAEAPNGNPFGNPTPPATKEGDDPFGTPAPTTPPQTMPKPAPADNPFGAVPAPATEKSAAPAPDPFGSTTSNNSAPAEPTPGGIGSLFHAFVAGSSPPPSDAAVAAPPMMGFEEFVKGFMGGGGPPGGVPPTFGQDAPVGMPAPGTMPAAMPPSGVPAPGTMPASGVPAPAATQPAADDPFAPTTPPLMAPQPARDAPAPPPAGDNDPFK
jgi:hypothetical protein